MGTDAHLVAVGGPTGLLEHAGKRLDELEARWSRFRSHSELCRLNAARGAPVVVSLETFELIELAIAAWSSTGGAFDPTVLAALEGAGYDRDFGAVVRHGPEIPAAGSPAPGCGDVTLDRVVRAVTLPRGVRIDLGGIGKGYAADLIADDLLLRGAAGVCVNLGGDLRVAGLAPSAAGWVVDLDMPTAPAAERPARRPMLALADGAVATTSRLRRTWYRGDRMLHHVIDPRTGMPAVTPWVSATVVAGRAADAEPLAKAALLAARPVDASAVLRAHRAAGVLIDGNGTLHRLSEVERFLIEPQSAPEELGGDFELG